MASQSLINQLSSPFYNADGTPNDRLNRYCSQNVRKISIDGNEFTGYKTYSFFWEKSYIKEPERSSSGTIDNLNSYATVITPHLQINFSLMSMKDYRKLYDLILSKNEFLVTCYNPLTNEETTNNMYFYPDSLPKLNMIARTILNGEKKEKWVELLGVQDYTIEMVGTNTNFEKLTLTYDLNVPSGIRWDYGTTATVEFPKNATVGIGKKSFIKIEDKDTLIQNITFNDTYIFNGWNTSQNGTGINYINNDEYYFLSNKTLYAQWKNSK